MCSPEMLINLVAAEGRLRVIAITDHDTMAGSFVARDDLERFPELAEQLEIVPGVEISSRDGHILGL
jgi:predicted metal-dependent phosphoesterase TrpH